MLKRVVLVLSVGMSGTPALASDAAFKAADAELNELYKEIERRLKDDQDTARVLVSAQSAWIAFRDAECKFAASGVQGGSAYPTIYSNCLAELTQSRVNDFKRFLKCQEGDLSCPVPPAK
jgi:uncharacterized protein YecT (DUF1311 family)